MAVITPWNTTPAACPTFRASSGVITPLARPRTPSVPKYLRKSVAPGCPGPYTIKRYTAGDEAWRIDGEPPRRI